MNLEKQAGPTLGISGGCDDLGPLPVGGPNNFLEGVHIAKLRKNWGTYSNSY